MSTTAKSFENGARNSDSTVVELNRVVSQAEELLKTLGEEGGAAAEAVRQRVLRTVGQARARLAETGHRVKGAANTAARATDRVRARESVEVDRLWRRRRRCRGIDRVAADSPRLIRDRWPCSRLCHW